MSITAITIRNFRSIVLFSDTTKALNIFVGQNDEGKSNVLRALDLFFNGESRHGYDLDWSRDFCAFAPARSRKADEITISLEITPPPHFKNSTTLMWKKVWRKEGLHLDRLRHSDGTEIGPRSKLISFARSMRFDYVPAIKGSEYFQGLMASLHDMLEATVEREVRNASENFTQTINANTQPILDGILSQMDLQTQIALPTSLRDLFAQLEFISQSGNKPFSLSQRGDGIKVRHIPIVLRWLAEQANALSAPGRPKVVSVWGYEEPENNLELRRCFELAQQFVDGSDTIQTFVTTHSPAFYSVCRHSPQHRVKLYLVKKGDEPPTTEIRALRDGDLNGLDSAMGLLDFLEPHFENARREIQQLKQNIEALPNTAIPTIFCEGPSDKIALDAAMSLFFRQHVDAIRIRNSTQNGGGHAWISDMLVAWSFSRPQAKAVGLFDKDEDAQTSRKKTNERVNPGATDRVYTVTLLPGDDVRECRSRHVAAPFALEEVLPADVWDYAEQQGWLEDRPNPIALYGFSATNTTFSDHIEGILPEPHLKRLALKKVLLERKVELATHVARQEAEERRRMLGALEETLRECLTKLGLEAAEG